MKKIFTSIEEYLCAACLAIMTIITFANVISRYVFSASFSFSEEITTYLFVLLSLMGAAIAAKRGAHLGFNLLNVSVPPLGRKVMRLFAFLFSIAFSALLFYYGLLMTIGQFQRQLATPGMQWPAWIFGAFVPLGSFFMTVRFAQFFITTLKTKEGAK